MNTTSMSLFHRLQSEQRELAWEQFVDLYAPLIFYWGKSHGLNVTDTADLVQEVLAVMIAKLPDFQYDSKRRFRGWLRTVTINKANDIHRRNSLRKGMVTLESVQLVACESEADCFSEAEHRSYIAKRALELMSRDFRDDIWKACWLHIVEGRSAADVARELGLTVNVVYLAKSRVLARLREELKYLID